MRIKRHQQRQQASSSSSSSSKFRGIPSVASKSCEQNVLPIACPISFSPPKPSRLSFPFPSFPFPAAFPVHESSCCCCSQSVVNNSTACLLPVCMYYVCCSSIFSVRGSSCSGGRDAERVAGRRTNRTTGRRAWLGARRAIAIGRRRVSGRRRRHRGDLLKRETICGRRRRPFFPGTFPGGCNAIKLPVIFPSGCLSQEIDFPILLLLC